MPKNAHKLKTAEKTQRLTFRNAPPGVFFCLGSCGRSSQVRIAERLRAAGNSGLSPCICESEGTTQRRKSHKGGS